MPADATVKHTRARYENNVTEYSGLQHQIAAEFDSSTGIAADPVVAYMSGQSLEKAIEHLKSEMVAAAKRMDFLEAAQYRDEIIKLQEKLSSQKAWNCNKLR